MPFEVASVIPWSVDAPDIADLLFHTRNLRGQAVDLRHRLDDVLINAVALRLQAFRGAVKVRGQITRGRQNRLPQGQARRVRRELLQAVKEVADIRANARRRTRKLGLNLLQLGQRRVERAVLLRRLIDLDLQHRIAQTFDPLQNHARAHIQRPDLDGIPRRRFRHFPRVPRCVGIRHIVGGCFHLLLADRESAQRHR